MILSLPASVAQFGRGTRFRIWSVWVRVPPEVLADTTPAMGNTTRIMVVLLWLMRRTVLQNEQYSDRNIGFDSRQHTVCM